MARLRRFITSYVGLVIGSLVVILVSMNGLAVGQANWVLGRNQSFGLISFAPEALADYKPQLEARSIVIGFENGIAGGLREAVTTLAGAIPVMSQRLIDEVRRDDIARASIPTGGSFGLSADAARAVAAQAIASTGLLPPIPGLTGPPPAATAAVVAPNPTPTPPGPPTGGGSTAVAASPTGAPAVATASRTSTASPTSTNAAGSGPNGGIPPTTAPASTPAPVATEPLPTVVPGAPTLVPAASPAATQTAAVQTPLSTATAALAATNTPVPPPTSVPAATATPEPQPTDVPSAPTAAPSATATATVPEYAMDLSVVGGSSLSSQAIFSGALKFGPGQSQERTVNVQNNGSRTFRYSLSTSGGSGVLWTDAVNGLQMTVTKNGGAEYSGPIEMADQVIGQLARGGQDTLVIKVSLPTTSGNAYQNLSTTVSYNFTAVAVP